MSEDGLPYGLVNPFPVLEMPVPSAGIFDTPHVTLRINGEWWSLVLDNLLNMTDEENWVGTDEEKYRATNEIMRFIVSQFQVLEDIRIQGVALQKTFDGETWIDVGAVGVASISVNTSEAGSNASSEYNSTTGELTLTIPRGDIGAQAALDEPTLNPDITDNARVCAVATGLVTWLFEKYNDTIDQFEAVADTVSAMDTVIALFPPGYVVADLVLDALNELAEFGSSLSRTYDTVERREEHQEWFFCHLQTDGALSQSVWNDYIAYITEQGSNFSEHLPYLAYIEFFKFDAARARAAKESYGEGNCIDFSCNEWQHEFNFANDGGMTYGYFPTVGLYPSGSGETGSFNFLTNAADSAYLRLASNQYADIVLIYFDLPSPREVTGVSMVGTGSTPSGATAQFYTELWLNGVEVGNNINLGNPSGSANFAPILCDRVTVRIDYRKATAISPTGNGHITAVTITGNGVDPFV